MTIEQAPWLGLAVAIVAIGCMVWGFVCSPWYGIAALGFAAFLVVMAMSFIIIAYGFYSITGVNMARHSLVLSEKNLVVEFEDGAPVEIPLEDIRPYKIYPGGVLMPVAGKRPGWLWIPPHAFGENGMFQDFLHAVYHPEERCSGILN